MVVIERLADLEAGRSGRKRGERAEFDVLVVFGCGDLLEAGDEGQKIFRGGGEGFAEIGERQRDEPAAGEPTFDAAEYEAVGEWLAGLRCR